jgi:hypothetical protein
MSLIRSLVNKENQKVSGQGSGSRKRSEQRERTAAAWFPVRLADDQVEEEEVSLKRKKISALDKGKQVQAQDVASSRGVPPADEGLFQLPRVWSQSDRFGPQASLYLGDSELKAIRELGTAGQARVVTDGVLGAMRALEVAVFLNNSSMEDSVHAEALVREREATAKKVSDLEAEVVALKASVSEKDHIIAFYEEKAEMGSRCRRELNEDRAKFAVDKKSSGRRPP